MPDSVSSVLKVFGILQALGEEREIGITELSQRVMMSKSTVYRFTDHEITGLWDRKESSKYSSPQAVRTGRARCRTSTRAQRRYSDARTFATDERDHPKLDEDSIVYIHKIDSMYNLRILAYWPPQPAVQYRD